MLPCPSPAPPTPPWPPTPRNGKCFDNISPARSIFGKQLMRIGLLSLLDSLVIHRLLAYSPRLQAFQV